MLNTILNTDCYEGISNIPNNSITLVVTSPPYNVNLGQNKFKKNGYNLYFDNRDHEEYIQWLKNIFHKIYPKLKKGGRIAINIGDGKNGKIPTHVDLTKVMTEPIYNGKNKISDGYLPFATIIWNKRQTGSRTAWGSFQSPSCPSFPTPFEYIIIFSKEQFKLGHKGETDLEKQEFIDWSLAMWEFTPETKAKKFKCPAPFPVELPKRCIKMLSWVGDTILDPFAGSGTTLVAAKALHRNYIGFEISEEYIHHDILPRLESL